MSKELNYLSRLVAAGKLDRRAFLGRAAALGATATFANTLLTNSARAAGPVKGGTIKVGVEGGSSSDTLDPALTTNNAAGAISRLWGEPLVELAQQGGLEGRVAESWGSTPDAAVWTFKIRSGITFSNGQPVTAQDALATLERHSGEDTKSGALGIMRGIKAMRAEGDELIIELSTPNADLPYLLTDYHLLVQPNGGKDDPTAAIGTGPYIIRENDPGVRCVAERNPNHWDSSQGHADSIEVFVINDDTARVAALQSGQVHMISRVPPRTADLVARAPNITVHRKSGPGHYVFIMHCNTAPFDNNDLRMALKYAINREEMVEKILAGYGSVGNDSPINDSYPLFTPTDQREYDPDKAAFHYKQSGFDGTIVLRTSDNSFPGAPDASALFQQSAEKAGIKMEVKREPNDGYWSEVWNKQPFCTSYWSGRPVQDQMLSTAYLSTADWNDTRFFNEQFDQLLVAARAELDEAKRTQMYFDANEIIRNEGGLICPMFNDFVEGVSNNIGGYENAAGFGLMNLYAPMKCWLNA